MAAGKTVSEEDKQRALEWNVDADDVAKARMLAKQCGHEDNTAVIFLYAKGINNTYTGAASGEPVKMFDLLMNPPNEHWQQCRGRLEGIMHKSGDNTADETPSAVMSFDSAVTKMPAWRTESAFIFHERNHINVVQRWQRSGLCYIHAAEVVQYYLVALHDKRAGMIDMAKMIRQTFHPKDLETHIFSDQGGSSYNMLKRILMPNSIISATHLSLAGSHLKEFGPLLISLFEVHEDFSDKNQLSFDGKPEGKFIGHHAMTIIGHRKDDEGKEWFLVQNWWPQMQFIEVSAEYLEACGATLYYVKTPQTEIPKAFPVQHHMFAENENVDKPEDVNFAEPECPTPRN